MSLLDLDAIPGYREACESEQANRNLATLQFTVPLCGIEVNQLNPRHVVLLNFCHNAFIEGGRTPRPEDICFFLWVISPQYSLDTKKRDKFIKRHISKLKYLESIGEINEYLSRTFQDSPGRSDANGPQYVAPVVFLVDLFASQYGWEDTKTLNTPLAALFQYMRAIRLRMNPKAIMFNESDTIKSKHLRARMGMN